jgi:hypothetical protein
VSRGFDRWAGSGVWAWRGLLTLRGNAFRKNSRSRAKLCEGGDAMHFDYIVLGLLIAGMLSAAAMALSQRKRRDRANAARC